MLTQLQRESGASMLSAGAPDSGDGGGGGGEKESLLLDPQQYRSEQAASGRCSWIPLTSVLCLACAGSFLRCTAFARLPLQELFDLCACLSLSTGCTCPKTTARPTRSCPRSKTRPRSPAPVWSLPSLLLCLVLLPWRPCTLCQLPCCCCPHALSWSDDRTAAAAGHVSRLRSVLATLVIQWS